MKKEKCQGCRNEFYNGQNSLGIKECWSFLEAKIVWKVRIGNWENPPYKQKAIRIPNCYHTERQGDHFVCKNRLNSAGFLK